MLGQHELKKFEHKRFAVCFLYHSLHAFTFYIVYFVHVTEIQFKEGLIEKNE